MINIEDLVPDRSQVKKDIGQLEADIETLTKELELEKAKLYTSRKFDAKPSDVKGRHHEFVLACSEDLGIASKETRLRSLKQDLKTKEYTLSEINYDQRERVVDSMMTAAGVFRAFSEAVKTFTDAVDKLVDSRKK